MRPREDFAVTERTARPAGRRTGIGPRVVALVCAGALALAVLAGCTASGPAPEPQPTPQPVAEKEPTATPEPLSLVIAPPDEGAYVGVFRPPAPYDIGSLDAYAEFTDKPPAILMWFQPWTESGVSKLDGSLVVSTWRRGAVPLITWEPWNPSADPNYLENPETQPDYQLKDIIRGDYDEYIRSWARGIKDLGGPVMLRPMHEMNGSWYPWCGTVNGNKPEEFVAAWRHVHDLFAEEGVDNVTWVWSINAAEIPDIPENDYAVYYPGDDYVDWASVSGFNWGTSRGGTWRDFEDLYTKVLKYLRGVNKPIMLAEFGTVPDGGDKPAWIVDAYRTMREKHPEIDAVVYYDKSEKGLKKSQRWQIDSSKGSVSAYREALSSPYFIGGPVPELTAWQNSLSQEEWARLRSITPVY